MNRVARLFTLALVLLVSTGVGMAATPAEEPPVVRALLDATGLNAGARPTYGSLDVAADGTITLSNVKTTLDTDSDTDIVMTYEVAELVLSDVKEIAPGVFEVGAAEWVNVTVTSGEEFVAAILLITAKSLYIHQPGKESTPLERIRASNLLAREFAIPEARMLIGAESIVFEDMSGTWEGDPMTGAGTSKFAARRIHVPGTVFEGADNPLAMAGYTELELAFTGTSTTTYADDALGFDIESRIDARDVGSLILELGADGIPLALFGALETTEPDPDVLLPFAEGISLKRARIRFEDASLTGRVLSLIAEAEDTDVATLVADGIKELDAMLMETLDPERARQVSAALTAYLNDPKSITFALAPAQPVNFSQIMAGLEDPKVLFELLQPSVTAND